MALASIGLSTHTWNTQIKSVLLLLVLPYVLLFIVWLCGTTIAMVDMQSMVRILDVDASTAPAYVGLEATRRYWFIVVGVAFAWYLVAVLFHESILGKMTGGIPAERTAYPTLYNTLENLCISRGVSMPKLYIIETDALNAYASGLSPKTYAVTVTTGLLKHLNTEELEAVLAHELSHIRNDDVFLSMIAVIFTGMLSLWGRGLLRGMRFARFGRGIKGSTGVSLIVLLPLMALCIGLGWFISSCLKFAFSRKREYLADAGAVELTKNPTALISALRKISFRPTLDSVPSDVASMCIISFGNSFSRLFSTHPPIEERIEELVRLGGDDSPVDMTELYMDKKLPTKQEAVSKRRAAVTNLYGYVPYREQLRDAEKKSPWDHSN